MTLRKKHQDSQKRWKRRKNRGKGQGARDKRVRGSRVKGQVDRVKKIKRIVDP